MCVGGCGCVGGMCVGEGNVRMCVCGEGGDTLIPDTQKLRSRGA